MVKIETSTRVSIIVQIITGLISGQGIFLKLSERDMILKQVLILETIVQVIELFFYIYFLTTIPLANMASIRYFDWFITTPMMLLTSIIFFKYEEFLEKDFKPLQFSTFVEENKKNISLIFLSNFLMLLFGYLGEIKAIDMKTSLTFGFVFFALTFYIIYEKYAKYSENSKKLFSFIFVVWGLYGIAAIFPAYYKNNAFNVLDIFAKNFFGLYLYYRIKKLTN